MSKTIKRALSLFLCAALLFGIAPLTAVHAADPTSGTCGANLTWSYNTSTSTLTISGTGEMNNYDDDYYNYTHVTTAPWQPYYNTMQTLVINSGVTSIGDYAFRGCTGLTSATVGNSVTSIGGDAFYNCTGLTSVTIPDSVTSIGGSAFSFCTGLTSVTIPDSVTSIGGYTFWGCTGLTSVTIPDSVTSIGIYAFWRCTGLTSVTIPDSVTSIGNGAFNDCTGLTSVTIPDSVTSIGAWAFSDCTGLTSVIIPDSVTSIGNGAFSDCTGLTSVTIPDSVTSIGNSAFEYCTGLTSVTIGNSVKSIGEKAFVGCTSLTTITVGANNPSYSSDVSGVLYNKDKTELIQYPCGSIRTAFTIPNSVTSIGDYAFAYCTGLTSVTIPASVTSIGNYAFDGCTGLTSVTIPDSVTSIGYDVFSFCTGLTSVTIPDSVTSIGNYAFRDCTGLTSVTIGNSVKSIGSYAFYNCTSLTSVTIPDSVTSIGEYAFYGCSNDLVIFGYPGSYAQTYAEDNNTTFVPITSVTYTLTYNTNGGSGAPASQTGSGSITLSGAKPTRSGYTFLGWATSSGATAAQYQPGATYNLTQNATLYAVWQGSGGSNIYNLGEETYRFKNYGDFDSPGGHCFGMSITSAGYYTGLLDKNKIGLTDSNLFALNDTAKVKAPICYYQNVQGKYSTGAIVAGGSFYKTGTNNITSDWNQVVNYVKSHNYDNKGSLQIGFRKDEEGGHAVNFLRYEEVSGQQRIYVYDNNFPTIETYFYQESNGKVYQAPKQTFSGAIDCIALRDVATYYTLAQNFDSTRYFYAAKDSISIIGADAYPIEADVSKGEYVMFEIPNDKTEVIVTPLVDNASFEYMDQSYHFNAVGDDTYGVFKLATTHDGVVDQSAVDFAIQGSSGKVKAVSVGDLTVNYKATAKLNPAVTADAGVKTTVTFESSDPNVVKVDANGNVTGAKRGSATITCTVTDSSGNTAADTCKVTVKYTALQWIIKILLFGWLWY